MATSNPVGKATTISDCEVIATDLYMIYLYRGPHSLMIGMFSALCQQTVAYKAYKRKECKH